MGMKSNDLLIRYQLLALACKKMVSELDCNYKPTTKLGH